MTRKATISTALVLGLSVIGLAGAAPPIAGHEAATGAQGELEALLWPSVDAPRRPVHRGGPLGPAALRDKIVVVSFVSVDCTIVCAVRTIDLDKLAAALPEALRDRVEILCIDTGHESGDRDALRGFADGLVGASSRLRFVAGDPGLTATLMAKLNYPPSALPEPPPTVLVFDRRGQVAMSYGSDPLDRARLLHDIALLDTFEDGAGQPPRGATHQASSTRQF